MNTQKDLEKEIDRSIRRLEILYVIQIILFTISIFYL